MKVRLVLIGTALLICAIVGAGLQLGCVLPGRVHPEELSAGHVGCPASEVVITDVVEDTTSTWTATCRGRRYHCTHHRDFGRNEVTSQLNCAPEQPPPAPPAVVAAPPPPRPPPPPVTAIVNRSVDAQGVVHLNTQFAIGQMRFDLGSAPIARPDEMTLVIENPNVGRGAACTVQLVIDGGAVALPPPSFTSLGSAGRWTVAVPAAHVLALSSAGRAVGRLCETDEFRFEPASQRAVAELVARYREERAFASPAP
jgi:hypothetical protein